MELLKFVENADLKRVLIDQSFETFHIRGGYRRVLVFQSNMEGIFTTHHTDRQIKENVFITADNELVIGKPKKRWEVINDYTIKNSNAQELEKFLLGAENQFYASSYKRLDFKHLFKHFFNNSIFLTIIFTKNPKRFINKKDSITYLLMKKSETLLCDLNGMAQFRFYTEKLNSLVVRTRYSSIFEYDEHYERRGNIETCIISAHDDSRIKAKATKFARLYAENSAYIDFQSPPSIVNFTQKGKSKINFPLKYVFEG